VEELTKILKTRMKTDYFRQVNFFVLKFFLIKKNKKTENIYYLILFRFECVTYSGKSNCKSESTLSGKNSMTSIEAGTGRI
jgi:hypothetical protein